jgi:chromosome segregation ATPase
VSDAQDRYRWGQDGDGYYIVRGPRYPEDCVFSGAQQARQMAEFLNKTETTEEVRRLQKQVADLEEKVTAEREQRVTKLKEATAEIGSLREALKQTREALNDAKEHLDYCGWGDSWERECAKAQGLEPKVDAALDAAEQALK